MCGHVNPEGTVLCEACGKPIEGNQHIEGNDNKKLLNMRYDGSARRSKTYNRSIVDKTWNFFSSVKVGVWLIVVALIASALGTIYPQEMYIPVEAVSTDPSIFYESRYGFFGKIYYQLGFHDLYSSWWYMIIIALIGVSLVIASIDRFVPLRRALKMQRPKRHETFINRQRLYSESNDVSKEDIDKVIKRLKKRRYKISEENGHVMAEKGRFSRWGPYVNHIGLIIILIAAILRQTSFMYLDEYVWVREGEQTVIPGTDREYFIENKKFTLETYDQNDPNNERFKDALAKQEEETVKNYQTDAIIYKKSSDSVIGAEDSLEIVKEDEIRLNHPLKFDSYTLYQAGYQPDEFTNMTFKIFETDDTKEEALGEFTVDLISVSTDSEFTFDNGLTVQVDQIFLDYYLDDGIPKSETNHPKNPAFVFKVDDPDADKAEFSFAGIGKNIDATGENKYKMGIVDYETHNASGITVRRDYTLPFFALGALIFMIGVTQGMYWQHRRIWLHPKDQALLLAAHTNKNWFGLKQDIEKTIEDTSIQMVSDQQELDE